MKKIILILAVILLTITSCTKKPNTTSVNKITPPTTQSSNINITIEWSNDFTINNVDASKCIYTINGVTNANYIGITTQTTGTLTTHVIKTLTANVGDVIIVNYPIVIPEIMISESSHTLTTITTSINGGIPSITTCQPGQGGGYTTAYTNTMSNMLTVK